MPCTLWCELTADETLTHVIRIKHPLGSPYCCKWSCRQLQHSIQDLSRQVTALVSQVQDLQGARQPRGGMRSPMLPSPQASSALVTSDDVISDRLVSFHDIQVSVNMRYRKHTNIIDTVEASNCACDNLFNALFLPQKILCTYNSGGRALKHQLTGVSLHCSDQRCPANLS